MSLCATIRRIYTGKNVIRNAKVPLPERLLMPIISREDNYINLWF